MYFGADVEIENNDGTTLTYRIVGADEFDPKRNWISVDSPIARALLKRRVGDSVEADTPGGRVCLTIVAVAYTAQC